MYRKSPWTRLSVAALLGAALTAGGCATAVRQPDSPMPQTVETTPSTNQTAAVPTAADAQRFVEQAESRLLELGVRSNRAAWVQATYITEDTQKISAAASEAYLSAAVELAKEAARYDDVQVSPDIRRRLELLKQLLTAPAPSDPAKTSELARLASELEALYGQGKYCPPGGGECLDVQDVGRIMAQSRDPEELLDVWTGWRTISPPMKEKYERFVELSNEGARELGYSDTGALWRSKYDMPPDAFAEELDRLWGQVQPLYNSLHCYVRWKLNEEYGDEVAPATGPIPAHLLGNIWAQEWGNIYDVVKPENVVDPGYDLDTILKERDVDPIEMVRYGERFFSSLGFDPLPDTFWERSLFVQPEDRDVVCHASAWDIDEVNDIRIKMCIEQTAEMFNTIHHELGHNYYQRAYNQLPYLYRNSANDGFHEAVGDTISLSVTPKYLVQIGLLDKEPPAEADIALLLRDALDSVAFLPFGLLIDQWRWKVFSGEVTPDEYNEAWWDLREKYQGVKAPVNRTEAQFDPGAKYHIPGNTPYTRYFLARILQFDFHRSLCRAAGQTGPLNRCTIYNSEAAGEKLRNMLAMGASRPWPEALAAVTGNPQMDATAIVDYFAPLKTWLDQQNRGKTCGW